TFDHATLDGGPDARVSFDKALGRATLTFPGVIAAGQHRLDIEYHGAIGRATQGFFAMDYAGPDGPRPTLAANFVPADARQRWPRWTGTNAPTHLGAGRCARSVALLGRAAAQGDLHRVHRCAEGPHGRLQHAHRRGHEPLADDAARALPADAEDVDLSVVR